ncbi:MAG: DUF2079 domain-containing protein, partial [Elusimicrobiota bacterium]
MGGRFRAGAWLAFAVGILILGIELAGFFRDLNTTASSASSGDIAYHVQVFQNFLRGKPFQMTILREGYGRGSHPPPYVNAAVIHTNFTPFLFVPLYRLFPGINGLYALVIGLNLLSVSLFGWFFLKRHAREDALSRFLVFLAVVFGAHFFRIASYQCHMLLFGTPFALIAHAALVRRNRRVFYPAIAALCLVSEDAAMFVMSYAGWIFAFEPDARREALGALTLGAAILALSVLVLMPAARSGMACESSSYWAWALATRTPVAAAVLRAWVDLWPALVFLFVLVAVAAGADFDARTTPLKMVGLVFLAPLSHWMIAFLTYGEHHLMPIFWAMIIALATMLALPPSARLRQPAWKALLAGLAVLFVV